MFLDNNYSYRKYRLIWCSHCLLLYKNKTALKLMILEALNIASIPGHLQRLKKKKDKWLHAQGEIFLSLSLFYFNFFIGGT